MQATEISRQVPLLPVFLRSVSSGGGAYASGVSRRLVISNYILLNPCHRICQCGSRSTSLEFVIRHAVSLLSLLFRWIWNRGSFSLSWGFCACLPGNRRGTRLCARHVATIDIHVATSAGADPFGARTADRLEVAGRCGCWRCREENRKMKWKSPTAKFSWISTGRKRNSSARQQFHPIECLWTCSFQTLYSRASLLISAYMRCLIEFDDHFDTVSMFHCFYCE